MDLLASFLSLRNGTTRMGVTDRAPAPYTRALSRASIDLMMPND
jgi:hypothetical protein